MLNSEAEESGVRDGGERSKRGKVTSTIPGLFLTRVSATDAR